MIDPTELETSDPETVPSASADLGPNEPGDELDAIYRREYRRLVGLAMLLVDDRESAEEVVQDAFVALHRAMGGTAADSDGAEPANSPAVWRPIRHSGVGAKAVLNPEGFLRRCVVNGGRDLQRRRAVRRQTTIEPREPTAFRFAELDDVIAGLPYRQRAALVLRYVEDLPEAAIAEALGVRPSTVRTLVRRGLSRLRSEIGE